MCNIFQADKKSNDDKLKKEKEEAELKAKKEKEAAEKKAKDEKQKKEKEEVGIIIMSLFHTNNKSILG